ncbi:MAG: hypothetical protein MJE68_19290 [Proteobacteria bacterium]|nr:hypothetical protein [Pseudomonadota bacterium]
MMAVKVMMTVKLMNVQLRMIQTKAAECIALLKKKYSIPSAARKLKMQYSHLHRLLSNRQEPHARSLSKSSKARIVNCYKSNKISMQLPFKRCTNFYYLRTSLAVAYDMYAKEQLKLGFKVLSQSSVYRSIKGQFRTRKRIPFKDTQCTDCVNNSLLIDALIVSKVKGIKRRMTENILNSLCPTKKKVKSMSHEMVLVGDWNWKRIGQLFWSIIVIVYFVTAKIVVVLQNYKNQ